MGEVTLQCPGPWGSSCHSPAGFAVRSASWESGQTSTEPLLCWGRVPMLRGSAKGAMVLPVPPAPDLKVCPQPASAGTRVDNQAPAPHCSPTLHWESHPLMESEKEATPPHSLLGEAEGRRPGSRDRHSCYSPGPSRCPWRSSARLRHHGHPYWDGSKYQEGRDLDRGGSHGVLLPLARVQVPQPLLLLIPALAPPPSAWLLTPSVQP